jgi:hypothetical protein
MYLWRRAGVLSEHAVLDCDMEARLRCADNPASGIRDLANPQAFLFTIGIEGEWTVRTHRDGNANDELTDDALLDREESERREYMRLEEREPHLRDTSYRELTGSKALLRAWERWSRTNIAMRLRGLLTRFQ